MKFRAFLFFLCFSFLFASCGGDDDKANEEIEKEAKESADEAAEKSLEKLNRSEDDTAKTDTAG